MAERVIELQQVSFSARNQRIVKQFSLVFEEGSATALVGPSGSGKSTVLKLSAGLLVPDGGTILFRGRDLARMNRVENLAFRREGAVVFQDSALWSNQTIRQNLELPLKLHFPRMSPGEMEGRIIDVLREIGYKKSWGIRPAMLSMGEQKLVAFARAVLCQPRLLFLDEWTESLDEYAARRLTALVKCRLQLGHTLIFVSHNFNVIRDLADHIVMIIGGEKSLHITKEQLAADESMARLVEQGMDG